MAKNDGTNDGINGFTAVNDETLAQNLAVKALNHRDWPETNGDKGADDSPDTNSAARRRTNDGDAIASNSSAVNAQLAATAAAAAAAAASVPEATDNMDVDDQQPVEQNSQPTSNGATYMDEDQMAHLLQQSDRADGETASNGVNDQPNAIASGVEVDAASTLAPEASASTSANNAADAPIITNAGLQVDMKKRKRAFANRTKTGCATCRRRKKKCDEGKPACGNCVRGGFTCLGYAQKRDVGSRMGSIQRHSNAPIAPANGRYSEGSSSRTPRGPSSDEGVNGLPASSPAEKSWPGVQDARLPPPWPSPSYASSRPVAERPANSLPPPPSYHEQRELPADPRRPSFDARYSMVQRTCDELMPPLQKRAENFENEPSHLQRNTMYQPQESLAKKDRETCLALCAKLNAAITEGSGPDEIHRRLQSIIQPASRGKLPTTSSLTSGELGRDVVVEAPFRADYGYNLYVGDGVVIEGGCFIQDPAPIRIGNNTCIGANVTITGQFMVSEQNWQGWCRKVPIRIGHNCVIGQGCLIGPADGTELIIGDNVYIAAGNVISQNIASGSFIGPPTMQQQQWRRA